jgi:hypothetical protein
MADYDFTACLSPLDFELLSKDLLEAELEVKLENFSEGRDRGIDLRYAPINGSGGGVFNLANLYVQQKPPELIVQCKRYSGFSDLKSKLKTKELAKIKKLNPARYILTTSVSLSPQQSEEIMTLLAPFVLSTGDIYGRERLNSLLANHPEIERRHIKMWAASAGVLESIINAKTHLVSSEEVERTLASAKIYVRNKSFDEALEILNKDRVCIISGLPGIGKTTLARMLLLYYYHRNFSVVKITGDISEARNFGYHNKPRFYYYDDFLGQTAQADKLNKNEDQRLLDFMASVRGSKDSVFVLTTREYILNQAKLHYEKLARENFNHRTCIIDLTKYSRRIRAEMLYNHLHFSGLPKAHLDALISRRGYVQIVDHKNYNPRLIEYLTDPAWIGNIPPADYLAIFLQKLGNPVEIWEHAFRRQLSDPARHLLFVLTTMPTECRIADVEVAFLSFHKTQSAKYRISNTPVDFNSALKELDGTFIATRKVQEFLLARFQNPSIRDFMQFLLLGGEALEEVILSLVFFEQAIWFIEILNEKDPQSQRNVLLKLAPEIVEAMRRLVDSESCTVLVDGVGQWARVTTKRTNIMSRMGAIALAGLSQGIEIEEKWMSRRIISIAGSLLSGDIHAGAVVDFVRPLKEKGLLDSDAGNELLHALKHCALRETSDLEHFELIAKVVEAIPERIGPGEIDVVRKAYADLVQQGPEEYGFSGPDDVRNFASRVGILGDWLQVDTKEARSRCEEIAKEIEKEEFTDWGDDDDRRDGGSISGECSDRDLDSIFGTLNG